MAIAPAFLAMAFSSCRQDAFYSGNAALIRILDAQDHKQGSPSDKYIVRGGAHLFYLEDLRAAVIKWDRLEANIRMVAEASDSLRARGIRLLVVPVPTKVETYPESLSGRNVFDISPGKNRFLRGLDSLKVEYLDLRPEFFRVKDRTRLFPHTDTHWDEGAIRLAAERLAVRIAAKPMDGMAPQGNLSVTAAGKLPISDTVLSDFQGDLAGKFHLAETDTVRLQRVGDGKGGMYAEPDSAGVLLFGDSFLNQYRKYAAHLGAHLAREAGEPVRTVYSLTAFTQGPGKIRALAEAYPETRVLIWVFTSRALMESAPQ